MDESMNSGEPKRGPLDRAFAFLWFGGIIGLVLVLPMYFTITRTGTAAWLIHAQEWIFGKLSGTPKSYPVVTGLVTAALHVLVLVGLVQAASLLMGRRKK